MILSGIADEAADGIDAQIRAHQELGWSAIELRLVDGKNVAGILPDNDFDRVADRLAEAGLQVTALASAIGNWSRNIADDFEQDVTDLKRSVPRMHKLGTKFIRTMSWVGEGASDDEWRQEVIRRYRELARIAEDGDILLAHENCTGWAGQSPKHMRTLIDEVGSDHIIVLYDTGNPISHGQDAWSFYEGLRDVIRYIHIKDGHKTPGGGPSDNYAYPGEGDALVHDVLTDQFKLGYDGVISIEPHIAKIVHDASKEPDPQQMYESYVRYGRMCVDIVNKAKEAAGA